MRRLTANTLACLALVPVLPAAAQGYPAKPVLVISPVQAGSAGDTTLRLVTGKMAQNMGVQLQVENTVGAAGLIGAQRLARAAPDGYTIGGVSDSTLTYVPIVRNRRDFEPLKVFEPISLVSASTWVLIVHPSVPARSVRDFVALAKREAGKLDFASGGVGGSHHVVMSMFASAAGIRLNHVPYKGATQAALDVQGGHVPTMFSALSVVLSPIKAGRLRALAVATDTRSVLLPDVPTVAESGVPGFSFATWTAMFAPRGTPKAIVDRLNAEVARAVNDPGVRAKLQAVGGNPRPTSPGELAELIRTTTAKMAKVVQDAGISVK